MKADKQTRDLLYALLEQIDALAVAEHRPAPHMVREAIQRYLQELPSDDDEPAAGTMSAAEQAVARILARRRQHKLPEGMTIRDMTNFGRA